MKYIIPVFLILLASSCNNAGDVTQTENTLLQVDLEFSDHSAAHGFAAAFENYCAEEGVLLRPDRYPIIGKDAIMNTLKAEGNTEITLTWEPLFAKAAASGELGYTYGIYTLDGPEGATLLQGTYVTIWEKKDGSWKFVLDTGNQGLGE